MAPIVFGGPSGDAASPESAGRRRDLDSMRVHEFVTTLNIWVGTVWLAEHDGPTEEQDLATFDRLQLIPQLRESYPADPTRIDRAATLEEICLSYQFAFHQPVMALIAQPYASEPTGRITYKTVMRPHELLRLLHMHYCVTQVATRLLCLTFDGVTGHAITIHGVDPTLDAFRFHDPWGARSLLCKENNHAGADARPAGEPMVWLLSGPGLAQVTVAVFVPLSLWRFWEQVVASDNGATLETSKLLSQRRQEHLNRLVRGDQEAVDSGPPMVANRFGPELIGQILPHPDPKLQQVIELSVIANANEKVPGPWVARTECMFADILYERGLREEADRWYHRARQHGDQLALQRPDNGPLLDDPATNERG